MDALSSLRHTLINMQVCVCVCVCVGSVVLCADTSSLLTRASVWADRHTNTHTHTHTHTHWMRWYLWEIPRVCVKWMDLGFIQVRSVCVFVCMRLTEQTKVCGVCLTRWKICCNGSSICVCVCVCVYRRACVSIPGCLCMCTFSAALLGFSRAWNTLHSCKCVLFFPGRRLGRSTYSLSSSLRSWKAPRSTTLIWLSSRWL